MEGSALLIHEAKQALISPGDAESQQRLAQVRRFTIAWGYGVLSTLQMAEGLSPTLRFFSTLWHLCHEITSPNIQWNNAPDCKKKMHSWTVISQVGWLFLKKKDLNSGISYCAHTAMLISFSSLDFYHSLSTCAHPAHPVCCVCQVAKAVSHSLNNCVNCLPGQKDVDMALKSIGEASKKLLIETVSYKSSAGTKGKGHGFVFNCFLKTVPLVSAGCQVWNLKNFSFQALFNIYFSFIR